MDTFVSVVGWVMLLCLAIASTGVIVSIAAALVSALCDRLKTQGAAEERVRLHRNLLTGSHWFSEHPPTSALMQEYANRVAQGGETNISDIRDTWRRSLQTHEIKRYEIKEHKVTKTGTIL